MSFGSHWWNYYPGTFSFLFWMVHYGIWDRWIVGFVKLAYWFLMVLLPAMCNRAVLEPSWHVNRQWNLSWEHHLTGAANNGGGVWRVQGRVPSCWNNVWKQITGFQVDCFPVSMHHTALVASWQACCWSCVRELSMTFENRWLYSLIVECSL